MTSQYVKSFAISASVAWGILPLAAQGQLIDLGEVSGFAINNSGQVALSTGIYTDGTVTPLPALPGGATPAVPAAINDKGQAAGTAVASDGSSHAVFYSNGTLTDLSANQLSGGSAAATGINASGAVVGWQTCPSDVGSRGCEPYAVTSGFIWSNGTFVGLGNLPGGNANDYTFNQPYGINDSGQVTGWAYAGIESNGFAEDAYVYTQGSDIDLGPGTGYAINASGQATGALAGNVFLYSDGKTTKLGGGVGSAINSSGQIVGSSGSHAFFYNGVMTDLNSLISPTDPLQPYVTLTGANGINDSLLILASGVDSRTGKNHAYLYQASSVQFAPSQLNFAPLPVGGTSEAQSITVTNAGQAAIPIGVAHVNGDFSLRLDTCGTSLAPGAQCRVAVVFLPKVTGALSGVLTIPAGGGNYQIPLSGIAPITAKISVSSSNSTVGQPITLTWTASAGSTCSASSLSTNTAWAASNPPFTGAIPLTGKQALTETVAGTMTYTVNCTAPGVAAMTVSAPAVWAWLPVTAAISASPAAIIAGNTVSLKWSSSNATSCSASGGGESDGWPGSKATSGSQIVTERFAPAAGSPLIYTITCTSSTSGLTASKSVSLVVSWPVVTATLSASPTTFVAGKSTTLTWTSSNATTCTASGGGPDDGWAGRKATSGALAITEPFALDVPSVVLTFTLTCNSTTSGLSGKAFVNVTESQAPNGSGAEEVTATISASRTTITVNQPMTLVWKSSNATSCTATGGGTDDSWAGPKATSGSQTVTETAALTSGVTLTFVIACGSSTTGHSAKASINVIEGVTAANGVGPPPSSGGGGALNPSSLVLLAGIFALRRARVCTARGSSVHPARGIPF